MLPFRKSNNGIASDIIPELIGLWNRIKHDPTAAAEAYAIRWNRLQQEGHHVYYEVRDSFNKTKNEDDFLFLTRTCVNGLIRYNSDGEFNNSMHNSRPGINPKRLKDVLTKWSTYVKGVDFRVSDYRETLEGAKKGDFVFLDPPYGGTKGRYTKAEFSVPSLHEQLDLLNSKGVHWMLTFDGSAGERDYGFALPEDLYKHKLFIKTGNSPFTKLMKTTLDAVHESVYLNFKPPLEVTDYLAKKVGQEVIAF